MKNIKLTKFDPTLKRLVTQNKPQFWVQLVQGAFCLIEGDQPIRAAVGFVSFGKDHCALEKAMSMFEKIKFPAAAFYLKKLSPFPTKELEAFAEMVDKIVVIESDKTFSVSSLIKQKTQIRPIMVSPTDGKSFTSYEIFGREDWN